MFVLRKTQQGAAFMGNIVKNRDLFQVSKHIDQSQNQKGLFFKDIFSDVQLTEVFQSFGPSKFRDRIFSPTVTLLAFLQQVLSPDRSCRKAVSQVNADRIALKLTPASSDTGAYCKARRRLPVQLLRTLLRSTGITLENEAPKKWLWKERHVKVVDGSTLTTADTKENRQEFGSPSYQENQKARCPMARFVAVFSLATGCVLDIAIGPYFGQFTSEIHLFLKTLRSFDPKDIIVCDSYYSVYYIFAILSERKLDLVFRAHLGRHYSFLKIKQFTKNDYLIVIERPERPDWMTQEHYERLPEELTLRVCKVNLKKKGFRSKTVIVLTTLVDRNYATSEEIGNLYHQRWQAELNLRSIKDVLNMHFLPSKTPEMVEKEILATLLAYNLIRRLMGEVAYQNSLTPLQISFKASLQSWSQYASLWKYSSIDAETILRYLKQAIGRHRVGNRPGRKEPRALKYGISIKYQSLTKPRNETKMKAFYQ